MNTYCDLIDDQIKKCIKPCPLLKLYSKKCKELCHTDNQKCKEYIKIIKLIIPIFKEKVK
jgi:hypothetical protein